MINFKSHIAVSITEKNETGLLTFCQNLPIRSDDLDAIKSGNPSNTLFNENFGKISVWPRVILKQSITLGGKPLFSPFFFCFYQTIACITKYGS